MDKNSFQSLTVWQKSMDLVEAIYRVSEQMPDHEKFGLVYQLRRAAVSIPSNTAEEHGRRSNGDFARFLSISLGSCREIQTLLMIARRLEYTQDQEVHYESCEEIAKMLSSLIKKVRS